MCEHSQFQSEPANLYFFPSISSIISLRTTSPQVTSNYHQNTIAVTIAFLCHVAGELCSTLCSLAFPVTRATGCDWSVPRLFSSPLAHVSFPKKPWPREGELERSQSTHRVYVFGNNTLAPHFSCKLYVLC